MTMRWSCAGHAGDHFGDNVGDRMVMLFVGDRFGDHVAMVW